MIRALQILITAALCSGVAQAIDGPDGPEHTVVYLTLDEAVEKVFPKADSVWVEEWAPTKKERRRIERRLGWRFADSTVAIHRGLREGADLGYALVGNEIGLYHPMTFIVKIDPKRKVESVYMMVYRESRGGEVRRRRYMSQYKGKSLKNPIRINRDIIGVTGATLSVRAINAGVKKALAIVDTAYPKKGK